MNMKGMRPGCQAYEVRFQNKRRLVIAAYLDHGITNGDRADVEAETGGAGSIHANCEFNRQIAAAQHGIEQATGVTLLRHDFP